MYIRTEGNETWEIYDEDDNQAYVMPNSDTEWGLFINDDEDEKPITIATFKTVKEANSALRDLKKAIEDEEGWDAIEYKNS